MAEHCRQAAQTLTTLIMQLATEAAGGGHHVSLRRLHRILKSLEDTTDLHHVSSERCRKARLKQSVAFRRKHILGRIIARPLEPLLLATPPVLSRVALIPLFDTIRAMVGDETYGQLDEAARDLYFAMLTTADYFEWEPFYEDQRSVSMYCDLAMLLTRVFWDYDHARNDFIHGMNARLGGSDSEKVFGADGFFTIFFAFYRPLQIPAGASAHRARLEMSRPRVEYGAVDALLEIMQADRQRWRKLHALAAR